MSLPEFVEALIWVAILAASVDADGHDHALVFIQAEDARVALLEGSAGR